MTILPIPFESHVPVLLKDNLANDAAGTALVNKADDHIQEWADDSLELYYLKWPERCPSSLIPILGAYLAAGINAEDTDRERRKKIYNAIESHKNRSLWDTNAKGIIDAIAGGNSALVQTYFEAGWILYAGESSDPSDYATTLGEDGVDGDLGIDLIGTWDETDIAGVVWIDVDNDSLTTAEVKRIVNSMKTDVAPAYFKVVLGYIDSISGFFTPYVNGTMG